MAELDDRLLRCFTSVFPVLTEQEIRDANVAPVIDADSLAGVTLIALIDQEFGVDIDLEDLLELGSFQALRQYLHKRKLQTF